MSYHYEIRNGEYYLMDGDNILHVSEEIAIGFTYDPVEKTGVMHKHGRPEFVEKWADETRKVYHDAGYHDMANEIMIIKGKLNIHELNKIISITGYIGKYYQRMHRRFKTLGK